MQNMFLVCAMEAQTVALELFDWLQPPASWCTEAFSGGHNFPSCAWVRRLQVREQGWAMLLQLQQRDGTHNIGNCHGGAGLCLRWIAACRLTLAPAGSVAPTTRAARGERLRDALAAQHGYFEEGLHTPCHFRMGHDIERATRMRKTALSSK